MTPNEVPSLDQPTPVENPEMPLMAMAATQRQIVQAHIQDAVGKLLSLRFVGDPDQVQNQIRRHCYEVGRMEAFTAIATYDNDRMKAAAERAQEQQNQQAEQR